ncbi:MAG: hypothetical protein IV106_02825 [Pseudomonas umsongensis]|nr:hypothetical protein [Pseudomonas umsongensis]
MTSPLQKTLDCFIAAAKAEVQDQIDSLQGENKTLRNALIKIIEMNRQHAEDQYGDPEKAESWSCITVARAALERI